MRKGLHIQSHDNSIMRKGLEMLNIIESHIMEIVINNYKDYGLNHTSITSHQQYHASDATHRSFRVIRRETSHFRDKLCLY